MAGGVNAWLAHVQVVRLFLITNIFVCVTAVQQSGAISEQLASGNVNLRCSRAALDAVQRHWKWLLTQTTNAEKVALYRAVSDHIFKHNPEVQIPVEYTGSLTKPVELTAYEMFSMVGVHMDAMRSIDKFTAVVHHLIYQEPVMFETLARSAQMVNSAFRKVIGDAIVDPHELTNWDICLEDMLMTLQQTYYRFRFRASCDVAVTSRLDLAHDSPLVHGRINFTQPAHGGRTTIDIELEGFQPDSYLPNEHDMHIYEAGAVADKCIGNVMTSHFNTQQQQQRTVMDDEGHVAYLGNIAVHKDGRATHTKTYENITLFGPSNIIGKALVIYRTRDDNQRTSELGEAKTSQSARGRRPIGCCNIYQTYYD
jgi:Cu/Zn superoxide dismutase